VVFRENGLRFEADPIRGQKTGFFLDQRDNRARVGDLARGRSVLNAFSYSGGFSLYAARGGAREVTSLDISQPALDAAARHFTLNDDVPAVAACQHELLCADAFEAFEALAEGKRLFDVVVVDPPAFAKKQSEVDRALSAYARLCRLALRVLKPGGELVLASCSSRVSAEAFRDNALSAASRAGRPLRIHEETGHALDHPVGFPEGAYLKCVFARA
jgi:23S rRNA (cytosine1962-C5)-methyltransferase